QGAVLGQFGDEGADPAHVAAFGAVAVQGQADDQALDLLAAGEGGDGAGGLGVVLARDEAQGRGYQAELVADRHAQADATVIDGEEARHQCSSWSRSRKWTRDARSAMVARSAAAASVSPAR